MYETNQKAVALTAGYLIRHSPCSRVQIAQDTGLTASIVTRTIKQMQAAGLVAETGEKLPLAKGSGRARRMLDLQPDFAAFLGIELSINGIYAVVIDTCGHVLCKAKSEANTIEPGKITGVILKIAQSILSASPSPVCAAGLTVPGHLTLDGKFLSNNPQWKKLDIPQIKKGLQVPLYTENNIEGMALGEYIHDSKSAPDAFMFLHIGPGMYCSSFQADKISRPKDFYTGEIGHMVADPNGSLCECGKTGCLQTFISDSWLIKKARLIWQSSEDTVLRGLAKTPDDITMDTIRQAYLLQDPLIRRDLDNGISKLALTLGNTLIMSDASKVFINSSLLQEKELADKLANGIRSQLAFIENRDPVEIEVLPYDEYRGAKGAATLAEYQYLTGDPDRFYRRITEEHENKEN